METSPVEQLMDLKKYSSISEYFQKWMSHDSFIETKQICVTSQSGDDLFGATGALWEMKKKNISVHTSDFRTLNSVFKDTPVESVVDTVKRLAREKFQTNIGRIRLMRLPSKTCYSYHIDDAEFRFHIPLITNPNCFFVVADQVYRMPEPYFLYKFKTRTIHTAVNASFEVRDHLVFDTYKDG